MKTQMLSAQRPEDIAAAAGLLRSGKLVAIPTETVYGLGANGLDENAVPRIFEAKGRPQDNPLIRAYRRAEGAGVDLAIDIPRAGAAAGGALLARPADDRSAPESADPATKRTDGRAAIRVAVRMPQSGRDARSHPAERACPLPRPRPICSGQPTPHHGGTLCPRIMDRPGIEAIVDGGPCEVGVESTIVDLTGERPRLLRPGGVTPEELRALLGELDVLHQAPCSVRSRTTPSCALPA